MPAPNVAAAGVADDLALITEAAREGGEIALRYFRRDPEVWMKVGDSPVTEADFAVDAFLRETLTAARPDYGWLSEETVDTAERLSARRTFVVDPIDGTRAFVDGRDVWCISIAVVEDGRPLSGVLDCPARGEVYAASLGGGARKNGRPTAVRATSGDPTVAGPKPMVDVLERATRQSLKRHPYVPSLAYRLAMLAEGMIDGTFVKPNSHDWDLAAADVILGESGGRILDPFGNELHYAGPDPAHGALAAGSGVLLDAMVHTIATYRD
ncbi:MAG: 3'(2'),5'-bisphosphate nucleotidase CysQ [Rhizobiaceae bacterium]